MGEFADMAIDDMLSMDEYVLNHFDELEDDPDLGWSPFRRDRRRNKIIRCSVCGKGPLHWLKEGNNWYLGDYNDIDEEIRHVCTLKGRLNALKRTS